MCLLCVPSFPSTDSKFASFWGGVCAATLVPRARCIAETASRPIRPMLDICLPLPLEWSEYSPWSARSPQKTKKGTPPKDPRNPLVGLCTPTGDCDCDRTGEHCKWTTSEDRQVCSSPGTRSMNLLQSPPGTQPHPRLTLRVLMGGDGATTDHGRGTRRGMVTELL